MTASRSLLKRLAVVALLPLLGGCVAMAALPVLAGGAMIVKGDGDAQQAGPAAPQASSAASGGTAGAPHPEASEQVQATALTELPRPGQSPAGVSSQPGIGPAPSGVLSRPWQEFVGYALEHAAEPASGKTKSALLEPLPSLTNPVFQACPSTTPAVIIDLDTGKDGLVSAESLSAPPGLAEGLARLREAGIVVIWISANSADHVREIGEALQRTGLDPEGHDPLVLAMRPGLADRKQKLHDKAGEDACVIAIAGDRRGDFHEMFDYLRNPADATLLDGQLGRGWFLVPPFG